MQARNDDLPDEARRALLRGAAVGAAVAPVLLAEAPAQARAPTSPPANPHLATVDLTINGRRERVTLDTRTLA